MVYLVRYICEIVIGTAWDGTFKISGLLSLLDEHQVNTKGSGLVCSKYYSGNIRSYQMNFFYYYSKSIHLVIVMHD